MNERHLDFIKGSFPYGGEKMWKEKVCSSIDRIKDRLIETSKGIFDNPELKFEEIKASRLISDQLQKAGFKVELGVAGLDTAIKAVHPDEKEGPTIAILGEYDALPEIGHGCGHNLIAAASLGAALALGEIKKDLPGRLIFFGTPAEEGGGGKVIMVREGLFKDVDAAMMFHPTVYYTTTGRGSLAVTEVTIEFFGKLAHAAGDPEHGINALDAVIQTFVGINALRQHIKDRARIHGIITHGGVKPNIVPDYAAASFYVRAPENDYCQELLEKLHQCAKGAALATGARLSFKTEDYPYKAMKPNRHMGEAFLANLEALGVPIRPIPQDKGMGSTDMGDVSQAVPAIHPYLSITDNQEIAGHSKEFAMAAISDKGHEAMLNAAKTMAMTTIDLYTDSELMERIREEFQNSH